MNSRNDDWAPIALFVYNRPGHARRMISSLRDCIGYGESPIFLFADGPATPRDEHAVEETRATARSLLGARVTYLERNANLGIDRSIIAGVTELCERFGKVVVVEDDLVLSPRFLRFLNLALRRYEEEPRVMQVGGYMFDVPQISHQNEAIFLPMISSWGWATWTRAWAHFDPAATGWQGFLRDEDARRRFDLDGQFAYGSMLAREMRRPVAAWDIRWYYSVFVRDGLGLFPPRPLVLNTGFDGSGVHDRLALPVTQAALETSSDFDLPERVEPSAEQSHVFQAIGSFRPSGRARKAAALARVALRRLARR